MDLGDALKRTGSFSPRSHGAAAVVGDGSFEVRIRCRHEERDPAAHAKADNSDARRIDGLMGFEHFDRGVDVRDNMVVAQSSFADVDALLTVRPVAMIEIDRRAYVSR